MMLLSDMLRLNGRYRPMKAAIIEGERTIGYAALDWIVDDLCHRLAGLGVAKGDLVGVALPDTAEHLMILLALARLGGVILPIDRRWSLEEKRGVAERFAADRVLVTSGEGAWHPNQLTVAPDWFVEGTTPYRDETVGADTPFLLSLSSGTTGTPKGPRLSQEQFVARFMIYWINLRLNGRDRFVVATPLYFGGGRGFALAILFAGATAIMFTPPYEPEALVAEVGRRDATALFLVPTLLRRLIAQPRDGLAFPTVRVLIASGSALYASEQRAIRAQLTPNLYQYYSSTEGGGVCVLDPDEFEDHPDSVGHPCFGVEVEVVDQDHKPLGADEIGQLRYRSPASPAEYHRGDSTASFRDGWFYPGDLAAFDRDGFLYLRGRGKDMIIRGGVNIYPMDIEKVLQDIAGVAEAAVVGVPSADFGEEIVAFVVRSAPVEAGDLLDACRDRLARYKVPRQIVFVQSLPKNAVGKILKPELVRSMETQIGTS
jgi:acyl-CoA synthetase (AMP-forming)/AMP-acid ligase II